MVLSFSSPCTLSELLSMDKMADVFLVDGASGRPVICCRPTVCDPGGVLASGRAGVLQQSGGG